jgi:hypothetical protein
MFITRPTRFIDEEQFVVEIGIPESCVRISSLQKKGPTN